MQSHSHDSHERALVTCSARATRRLGRAVAARAKPGDLICLRGDLGAGKTTFVQGLAEGLAVSDPVTSPSFTLIHEHQGSLKLYHLDLYRLRPGDLGDIGVEELLEGEAVVAVEWSERMPPELCRDGLVIEVQFEEGDVDARRFHLRGRGPRGRRLLDGLVEDPNASACA